MAANIGNLVAKGQNALGAVNSLRDILPDSITKNLDTFINGTRAAGASRKGVNNILSTINGINGVQRASHFYVTIPAPLTLTSEVPPLIPFLTESATLPGVALATSSVKRYGFGPEEKKPYLPTFVDVSMSFIGDGKGVVYDFFYKWMNSIVRFDKAATAANAFEVEWKNKYATDITITTIDETGSKIIEVVLMKAYPVFLGDIAVSWHDTDSLVKIPVGFTYYNWKKTEIDLNAPMTTIQQGASALQRILGAASAIQVLSNIRKPRNIADLANAVNSSKLAIRGLGKSLF